ncbi:MAG: acyltransferase [Bacteroidota bacterium]
MGVIRVLLALSVVIAHSNPIFGIELVGGPVAVQAFYMISGFYMALILHEKYKKPSQYGLFISNRFLRIYPIYWFILLCSIGLGIIVGMDSGNFLGLEALKGDAASMSFSTKSAILWSHLVLFGQDVFMFLGLNLPSGNLEFTSNFWEHPAPAFKYLLVPQAWTIGVELMFYLIAPFLVRRRLRYLLLLMFASALLRILFYQQGFSHDPWSNRFFPFELFFFLAGSISYRIYRKADLYSLREPGIPLLFVCIAYLLLYSSLPFSAGLKAVLLYGLIFISMPFIFLALKTNRFDREIGEYSYTIYLSHVLIIGLLQAYDIQFLDLATTAIIGSFAFSYLIIRFISNPIEQIRQARVKKKKNYAHKITHTYPRETVKL